jgi:hypothetical protein
MMVFCPVWISTVALHAWGDRQLPFDLAEVVLVGLDDNLEKLLGFGLPRGRVVGCGIGAD